MREVLSMWKDATLLHFDELKQVASCDIDGVLGDVIGYEIADRLLPAAKITAHPVPPVHMAPIWNAYPLLVDVTKLPDRDPPPSWPKPVLRESSVIHAIWVRIHSFLYYALDEIEPLARTMIVDLAARDKSETIEIWIINNMAVPDGLLYTVYKDIEEKLDLPAMLQEPTSESYGRYWCRHLAYMDGLEHAEAIWEKVRQRMSRSDSRNVPDLRDLQTFDHLRRFKQIDKNAVTKIRWLMMRLDPSEADILCSYNFILESIFRAPSNRNS